MPRVHQMVLKEGDSLTPSEMMGKVALASQIASCICDKCFYSHDYKPWPYTSCKAREIGAPGALPRFTSDGCLLNRACSNSLRQTVHPRSIDKQYECCTVKMVLILVACVAG